MSPQRVAIAGRIALRCRFAALRGPLELAQATRGCLQRLDRIITGRSDSSRWRDQLVFDFPGKTLATGCVHFAANLLDTIAPSWPLRRAKHEIAQHDGDLTGFDGGSRQVCAGQWRLLNPREHEVDSAVDGRADRRVVMPPGEVVDHLDQQFGTRQPPQCQCNHHRKRLGAGRCHCFQEGVQFLRLRGGPGHRPGDNTQ